jgi:hypothetical protein
MSEERDQRDAERSQFVAVSVRLEQLVKVLGHNVAHGDFTAEQLSNLRVAFTRAEQQLQAAADKLK